MKSYLAPFLSPEPSREASWMDETPLWSAPFGLKLLDVIRLEGVNTVLDVGFGFGFPLIEIALRLRADARLVGMDPWDLAHQKARPKINLLKLTNIELLQTTAESIPFAENTFDLITSNNGINNVDDMPACLRECYRVNKRDGQFVFTMNTENTMPEFYSVLKNTLGDMQLSDRIPAVEQHIYEKRKPTTVVRQWLLECGFIIHRILEDSFALRYADGSTMLNHYFIRDGFLSSWAKLVPKEKLEAVFDQVEQKLNAIAAQAGELRLTIPFLTYDCRKQ